MRDNYLKQIEGVKKEISTLEIEKNMREKNMEIPGVWESISKEFDDLTEVSRELVESVIERIEVYKDSKIKITLNCLDEIEKLRTELDKRRKEIA